MATYRDMIHEGCQHCDDPTHHPHVHCAAEQCKKGECSLCVKYQQHRDTVTELVEENGDILFHVSELLHMMGF